MGAKCKWSGNKRSRFRSTRCEYDGIKFHSKKERDRYIQLKAMEGAGLIRDLRLQPKFECWVEGVRVCNYLADFQYIDVSTGLQITEDVKSPITRKEPVYRLKRKLVSALYPGTEIRET